MAWKEIAGGITGKAVGFASTVLESLEYDSKEKPIIPSHTVIFVPLSDRNEAHYLCSVLNSSILLLAIASYTYELRMESHILKYLFIPKFDPKNPLHRRLSQFSQKAHEITKKIYEENREDLRENLKKIEEEIDKTVAELYGITDDELKEIKKCLIILKEGKIPDEEKEGEEE